jgi:hypothetical protein
MNEDTGFDGRLDDQIDWSALVAREQAELYAQDEQDRQALIAEEIERKAILHAYAVRQRVKRAGLILALCAAWAKFPSFLKSVGRKPVAGQDYDPDGSFEEEDAQYFDGFGRYSDIGRAEDCFIENDVPLDGDAESALASVYGEDRDDISIDDYDNSW